MISYRSLSKLNISMGGGYDMCTVFNVMLDAPNV